MSLVARQIYGNKKSGKVPITGLVSYYKLETSSVDSYGTNNGVDTAITYGIGKIVNGAIFNGSTSQIAKASASFDFFGTQNLSFNCWVKPSTMPSPYNDLISIQESSDAGTIDKSLRLYFNGSIGFYAYDGAVKTAQSVSGLVSVNNWYMVTGTFDAVNLKVYLNGVLKATLACSGTYNFSNPKLSFGKSLSGVLNGILDEIAIYNIALAQNNIDILYSNGNGATL